MYSSVVVRVGVKISKSIQFIQLGLYLCVSGSIFALQTKSKLRGMAERHTALRLVINLALAFGVLNLQAI